MDGYQVMRHQLPRQSYDEGALGDLHRPGQRSHLRADGGFVRSKEFLSFPSREFVRNASREVVSAVYG